MAPQTQTRRNRHPVSPHDHPENGAVQAGDTGALHRDEHRAGQPASQDSTGHAGADGEAEVEYVAVVVD